MLSFTYEEWVDKIDCHNLPPDLLSVKGIPYDLLKLFEKTTLRSLLAYSPLPNRLTFSFLKYAIDRQMVSLFEENGVCWIRLREEFKPREFSVSEEKLKRAIEKAQRFYAEVVLNPKEEYYQDLPDEFPPTFHKAYLERLFFGGHFPFVQDFKYLVVGDDEGKGLALHEITEGRAEITVADVDERIVRKYGEMEVGVKTAVIDTRFYRNKFDPRMRFDVVISYSLLNTSLNTLKDFLTGTLKDYGVAYLSMYPALFKELTDLFSLVNFFYDWGFWITDWTPYFVRLVKIPQLWEV
jgi:hypothetical protein